MSDTVFKPSVYLLHGCPFCMKLRLFLLEAKLIDQVDILLVKSDSDELRHVKEKLAVYLPKVGFPTVELTPGQYMAESDDIIAWFAEGAGIDIETLPTFQDFASGIFNRHLGLYRENMQLKQQTT
ncbi:glutathione S-transferase N-terminal domain-containing protein [Rhizobium lusitanum]|uniref:glutathione S-transferase N-terminal domain-containing protein n=1 Tax=Rhizobium lusitanum TaxID=293958 RepID=UPI00195BC8F7|nr:glutathione S-transferase N-terminal domain-containing protein [Rhizobium lusitanum]MBM7048392.1 glutathione S-transferase N-terminal domain-containing protein [Rhizobium lusitanum]